MRLKIKLENQGHDKDLDLDLQKWEDEGGGPVHLGTEEPHTGGLLKDGQQFEVLKSHLQEENGYWYQVVEVKPLEAEKRL